MKNTLISLDLIFISKKGVVTHIHPQAIPHDLTPIPSNGNAAGVLEINGGQAQRLNIAVGDMMLHPFFSP